MAYQYLSKRRTNSTDEVPQDLGSQQSFIDLRGDEPEEGEHPEAEEQYNPEEAYDSEDEEFEEEEQRQVRFAEPEIIEQEPERDIMDELIDEIAMEDANRRRELTDDLPRSVRRRLEETTDSQSRSPASTAPEPEAENSLRDAWRRSNTEGAGVRSFHGSKN